jgi:hypothetical protein
MLSAPSGVCNPAIENVFNTLLFALIELFS